ncbi:MAG TPA: glutathione S-transferase family protein [Verrucomicrobiae bacterium]|nr:glutathione S-transferase family protein [Verrucomicrobiae bacterium]
MSDAFTLYGSSSSGNSLKPKWVAETLGLSFRWVEVNTFNGETRTPEFLKLNPAGQAPVLVFADGRTLAQSNAIMLHLAEGSALVPNDAFARAKMFEWMFWEQYSHEPTIAVRIARKHYLGMSDSELDPALLTKGNAALARLELQLQQSRYLVADAITLADVALVAYTRVAHRGGFDLNQYPKVQDWVGRVEGDLGLLAAD